MVGAALRYANSDDTTAFSPSSPFEGEEGGGWEDFIPYEEETPLPTTIERGPTAQGLTLSLLPPGEAPLSYQEIYQQNLPSVVSVLTTSLRGGSTGTGVILTADGYIITNHHVIQGGSAVEVVLHSGAHYDATLVGSDQTNDLAVLKINANQLTPAQFGNSDLLQVGGEALAIGNPLGEELRGTLTSGIISAIDRNVRSDGNTMTLIQTTAALNSGNSGGALINTYGQVVGITNMKMMSDYNTIEGLGFAIPSATAKTVVEALISQGRLTGRPVLGFSGYSLDAAMAQEGSLVPGVYVSVVDPKSDAQKQDLRPGDVVVACNGQDVHSVEEINTVKSQFQAGDDLTLKVYRAGNYLEVKIRLMERYELDD